MEELNNLLNLDFNNLTAKEFSNLVTSNLKSGFYKKEVSVQDRGDGRTGRVDIVWHKDGKIIGIELDRFKPRKKSVFKLKQLMADETYVITRSPVKIIKC